MGASRDLIRRYPAAAIAVVVAAACLGGWTIYRSRQAPKPGVQTPAAPIATVPSGPPGAAAVTPTWPAGPTGSAAPATLTSPGATAATGGRIPGQTGSGQTTAPPETADGGRANPFAPLVTPQGSGPVPAGGPTIPPVPPLPLSGPAGPAQGAASPAPLPQYRLVGFLWGDTALAILEDGQGSYIVGPGDTVTPGTKVVAIDVRHELLHLDRGGTAIDLAMTSARNSGTF